MITILITIGTLQPERREPVLSALRQNLANPLIQGIHVVTEAPSAEAMAWLLDGASCQLQQLHITYVGARPTFTEMLRVGNELLISGVGTVAIMNADISIASAADANRMLNALNTLNGRNAPVLLALTRHEAEGDQKWIGLYDLNGLPNTISADAWVFQKPLQVDRDLFYMPGQMNCDMFLAYDLLSTGHQLFNPCLDVAIVHHEPAKDESFYKAKNLEKETQLRLEKHALLNQINPWNYYGSPWIKSSWLHLDYKPAPSSTTGRRLIVAVLAGAEHRILEIFKSIDKHINTRNIEVQILYEGDLDLFVQRYSNLLSKQPHIWVAQPEKSIVASRYSLLAGKDHAFKSIAFVNDASRIDDKLLASADAVFLTVGTERTLPPPQTGCTLITSVFRSDAFIRGFVRNIKALNGYNRLIEHLFLVSSLSEYEVDTLSNLLISHSNVAVLWHHTDPGLYECWNIGIRLARTEYVSNANVDDLRHPQHVVTLLRRLEAKPHIVVAATALVPFYEYPETEILPEVVEAWYSDQTGQFRFEDIARLEDKENPRLTPHNIPHCMPVWRRSLHDRFGWFDEVRFGTYADWAFWLKALEGGNAGWLDPAALSFYYVNPTSHNRRGANLEKFHRAVEEAFIPSFQARLDRKITQPKALPSDTPRKLHLMGLGHSYGEHRNSFSSIVSALEPLNMGPGGIRFVPFLERQFVWGDSAPDGEAASSDPRPIVEPWIGILHVPFDTPDWFDRTVNPKQFFATPLFRNSLRHCCGLITLCDELERDLKTHLPEIPTLSLKHPTELSVRTWEPAAYEASPCVVQVGDWLRKLQAIHRLRAPGHRKVMLLKSHTLLFLQREIEMFGDHRDATVETLKLVPDEQYDAFLAQSVVLCLLYSTAANNLVIECIARATPILINPLPGAILYLGENYPLYVKNEREAAEALSSPRKIFEAHHYLIQRNAELSLSYKNFCFQLADSHFYKSLGVRK